MQIFEQRASGKGSEPAQRPQGGDTSARRWRKGGVVEHTEQGLGQGLREVWPQSRWPPVGWRKTGGMCFNYYIKSLEGLHKGSVCMVC